jgi:WD40 repeat protein
MPLLAIYLHLFLLRLSISPTARVNNILVPTLWSELQLEWQGQLNDLVTDLVCAPNGTSWAASSAAGSVIWTAGLTESVTLHEGGELDRGLTIDSIAFSADSRWLAAAGQAGQLLIWNCEDTSRPPQLVSKTNFNKWIEHLVWHPTESLLAIGYGAELKILNIIGATAPISWQFVSAKRRLLLGQTLRYRQRGASLEENRSSIFDLAWHPHGKYLAVAGYQGVQIWTPRDREPPIHITTATASIKLSWSSDGRYLAAGNLDRTITIIDWHHPSDPWLLQGCPGKIRQLVWLKGTTTPCLAVASGTEIILWQLTGDLLTWNGRCLEGHQGTVEVLAAHPHAPILGSGGTDGCICLWSADGAIVQILTDGGDGLTALAWQPHGEYLAAGTQTGSIGQWSIPA